MKLALGFTAGVLLGKTLLRVDAIDSTLGAIDVRLTDWWIGSDDVDQGGGELAAFDIEFGTPEEFASDEGWV